MPAMNILPKTTLSFPQTVAASTVSTQPMAINIPCADYREAVLLLRVHSFTGGAGAEVSVALHNSAPSSEDPASVFRMTNALANSTLTVVWAASLKPTLAVNTATITNLGEALDLMVSIKQASTATVVDIAISVDLVLKAG